MRRVWPDLPERVKRIKAIDPRDFGWEFTRQPQHVELHVGDRLLAGNVHPNSPAIHNYAPRFPEF